MQNTKFFALLQTLSKAEFKTFRKFVASPYYCTNPKAVQLLDYLQKSFPNLSTPAKRLTKERVYSHLYPNESYKEIKLQQLASQLVKLVEQFWVVESKGRGRGDYDLQLAKAYRERGFGHYWEKQLQVFGGQLKEEVMEFGRRAYFDLQAQIEVHEQIEEAELRNREPNLQEVSDALDVFYWGNKLRYYCKALNYQRFQSQPYEWEMMEEVLEKVKGKDFAGFPAIQIYYQAAMSLRVPKEEAYFRELYRLLQEYKQKIHRSELQDMLVLARNYCIFQLNQGNRSYLRTIFEVYGFEIGEGLVLKEGNIPNATYKNIVTTALLLKELKWLEVFLYDFEEAVSDEAFYYNLARLRFQQEEYEESIHLLQLVEYKEVLLLLSSKALMLQSYYERCCEYPDSFEVGEQLEQYLHSFTTFLNRKKQQLTNHYIYYVNLVELVKGLWECENVEELETLDSKVDGMRQVAEKVWLMDKIQIGRKRIGDGRR
ncbi:MAG: hypothetical protein AB8B69_03685 [Chitinophagales bacterium]